MTTNYTSRVPQALANLFELLDTSPDLKADGSVAVCYGLPTQPESQIVSITGQIETIEQTPYAQGARSRDEMFSIEVRINVLRTGDDARTALERAFALLGVIELRILRPNVTLQRSAGEQGPLLMSHITPTKVVTNTHPDGVECEITALVLCKARI